jgi:hypothetical protein
MDKKCNECGEALRRRYPGGDPENGPASMDCSKDHAHNARIAAEVEGEWKLARLRDVYNASHDLHGHLHHFFTRGGVETSDEEVGTMLITLLAKVIAWADEPAAFDDLVQLARIAAELDKKEGCYACPYGCEGFADTDSRCEVCRSK